MGNSVMERFKHADCSGKKQMLDVSCYTASPADQDIIYTVYMTWAALYTDRSIEGKRVNRVSNIRRGDREGYELEEEWREANRNI